MRPHGDLSTNFLQGPDRTLKIRDGEPEAGRSVHVFGSVGWVDLNDNTRDLGGQVTGTGAVPLLDELNADATVEGGKPLDLQRADHDEPKFWGFHRQSATGDGRPGVSVRHAPIFKVTDAIEDIFHSPRLPVSRPYDGAVGQRFTEVCERRLSGFGADEIKRF